MKNAGCQEAESGVRSTWLVVDEASSRDKGGRFGVASFQTWAPLNGSELRLTRTVRRHIDGLR